MSEPELLPCLFDCDNHGGKVVMRATRRGGLQVFCNSCNARGPVSRTRTEAIADWSRRTPAPEARSTHTRLSPNAREEALEKTAKKALAVLEDFDGRSSSQSIT